jgi:hypothetical protein
MKLGYDPDAYYIALSAIAIRTVATRQPTFFNQDGEANIGIIKGIFDGLPIPDFSQRFDNRELGEDFSKLLPILLMLRVDRDLLKSETKDALPTVESLSSLIPERFQRERGYQSNENIFSLLKNGTFIQSWFVNQAITNESPSPKDIHTMLNLVGFVNGTPRNDIDSKIMGVADQLNLIESDRFTEGDHFKRTIIEGLLGRQLYYERETIKVPELAELLYFIKDTFRLNLDDLPEKYKVSEADLQEHYFHKYIEIFIPPNHRYKNILTQQLRDKFYQICGRVLLPKYN